MVVLFLLCMDLMEKDQLLITFGRSIAVEILPN
jgi:hypothetical protein